MVSNRLDQDISESQYRETRAEVMSGCRQKMYSRPYCPCVHEVCDERASDTSRPFDLTSMFLSNFQDKRSH